MNHTVNKKLEGMNEDLQWMARATEKTGTHGWYDQQRLQDLLEWRIVISAEFSTNLFQHSGRTTLLLFKAMLYLG